jgi:hypothetical protein
VSLPLRGGTGIMGSVMGFSVVVAGGGDAAEVAVLEPVAVAFEADDLGENGWRGSRSPSMPPSARVTWLSSLPTAMG